MIFSEKNRKIATTLLVLSACAKAPESPNFKGETGTFVADMITATSSDHLTTDSTWNFQRTHILKLRTCMKDVGYVQPIIGQTFIIRDGEKDIAATTDAQGCLSWTESMSFNYIAPEVYATHERTFVAQRPHRGTQTVSLAINPWRTDATSVMDLRYGTPQKLVSAEGRSNALLGSLVQNESQSTSELVADSITLELSDDRTSASGVEIAMHLVIRPQFMRQHLDGISRPESLKTGKLKLSLALIEKIGNQRTILARNELSSDVENGTFNASDTLRLTRLPVQTAQLEFAYRLEAIQSSVPIRAEEGTLQIPSVKMSGSVSRQKLEIPFSKYLGGEEASADGETSETTVQPTLVRPGSGTCTDGSENIGFYFDRWKIESGGVVGNNSRDGFPNEIGMNLSVCLKNAIDHKAVAGHPFQVQLLRANGEEGPAQARTSDAEGCIFWNERLGFDYFQPEQWFKRSIRVTSSQAPLVDVSRTLPIQINPWQQSGNFSWDCRNGQAPRATNGKPARLDVTDMSYLFLGQDFEIDKNLNMTFKRKYQLRMQPMIVRQSAFDRTSVTEGLRDGKYRLRVLLLSPSETGSAGNPMNAYKYLSSYEAEVQTRNGLILDEIVLPADFQELPLVAYRNEIFVELSPIGSSSLKSVTVRAPFSPLNESGAAGMMSGRPSVGEMNEKLVPTPMNVSELMRIGKNAKEHRRAAMESGPASFRKVLNLREITPAEIQRSTLSQQDMEALVRNPQGASAAIKKFCALLYSDTFKTRACHLAPGMYVQAVVSRHVDKVFGAPRQLGAAVNLLSVNAALSTDSSTSTSVSTGVSDSVNAGVGAKLGVGRDIGIFNVGLEGNLSYGKSWFKTRQVTTSTSTTKSLSASFGKTMAVEELEFSVDAQMKSCVAVEGKKAGARQGFHICPRNSTSRERIKEYWYYVAQTFSSESSPLRDIGAVGNRPWLRTIRGKAAFQRFKKLIEDRMKVVALDTDRDFSNAERGDATQAFVNTYPIHSDSSIPALLE